MLSWLTTPEGRRIIKIRFKLWWHFKPFWYTCPYRVILKFRVLPDRDKWPSYWTYVSLVQGQKPCEVGPEQMWTPSQAIAMAKQQWLATQEVKANAENA